MSERHERHLGLYGATALGVGAIVGGGILALAGVAFATAGAAAILAFALNGGIAFLTAVSFARLARRFPESGGTYTYAKRVLSIEVAFVVGWVVWFASIVAGVLYALGFAAFSVEGLLRLLPGLAESWSWVGDGRGELVIALAAIGVYSWLLVERTAGGGNAATIGKVIVFVVLLAGGAWAWVAGAPAEALRRLSPFAPAGSLGVLQAMGYTFIALQGFDLIAAVGGEVKDPRKTLPRAMYLSLGIALVIYIPLLIIIATVGAPPGGIHAAAEANPEGLVAAAAERYMGVAGYWLVIGAGLLSMLSALNANLFGASRVAFSMARDRTLPRRMGEMRGRTGTPAIAVVTTGAMMAMIVLAVGSVAAAGAASSLIFLVSFAMVHCTAILAQRRGGDLRLPFVPVAGAVLCLGLAVFQAVAVPAAGRVAVVWLGIGVALYLMALAPGARLADASAEARDPDLARSRGRSPLVLAPIANPASAASLTDVAATVCTPNVGRVLLLSVLRRDALPDDAAVRDAQDILSESMGRSLESSARPETLFTIATDVWSEIARVADLHRCETVLVGLPRITEPGVEARLEGLISNIEADVVIVRAPPRWRISEATRILVPVGGRSVHSHLRARLLASLSRSTSPTLTFVRALPPGTGAESRRRFERVLRRLARDEAAGPYRVELELTDDPVDCIAHRAEANDLVVMGMENRGREKPLLGPFALEVARKTTVPLILLGRRADAGSFAARGIAHAVSTIQRPMR
ncbi:amino acid permease [Candidatus Palauibacter sp.]|uniref:amino acid permease n=1 Tax=Candidatus Palauibacter sp. TaxID=3101350 RepID=UPI003B015332